MNRRIGVVSLFVFLAAATPLFLAPLMHRTQTMIDLPESGKEVALSGLSYKSNMFEAKVTSAKLDVKSGANADPVVVEWTFLGTNTDGQMHKVEIFTRLQDETGKQLAMSSGRCMLSGGAHDQSCKFEMKVSAADWKATKAVRIVTDWQS